MLERVLRLEIIPDPVEIQTRGSADLAFLYRSRDIGFVGQENDGDETNAVKYKDFSVLRVKTMHINSAILAEKSYFFYKIFTHGKKESKRRVMTLRIHASEEAAVLELLRFLYYKTLSASTPSSLLNILMTADKFDAVSCMRYCGYWLSKLTMTCESAVSYLDLSLIVLHADALKLLTDLANSFISAKFRDLERYNNELLKLPQSGIETILLSDNIQVDSEEVVYDFVVQWGEHHYPKPVERKAVLNDLYPLIRFPHMSVERLDKLAGSMNISPEVRSAVYEALDYKSSHIPQAHARFVERLYTYRPVRVVELQVVELQVPLYRCIVYLDLKRDECVHIFPAGKIYSQSFYLGPYKFFLLAHCDMIQEIGSQCFGLFLGLEGATAELEVDYKFAVWSTEEAKYTRKYKGNSTMTGGDTVGLQNLFGTPWATFIADDSPCFVNGRLRLKAEVSAK